MDKATFLTRFLLSASLPQFDPSEAIKTHRKAAVLIGLVERRHGLNVIFTERARHLRHHPGQISFPGGKYERFDKNLKQTAIRETNEEIGIKPDHINIIGELAPLKTVTGFEIFPYVAFIDQRFTLHVDLQEVSTVFEAPFTHFLDRSNSYKQPISDNKTRRFTHCIPYQNHLIWGATAQIIKNLQAMLYQG